MPGIPKISKSIVIGENEKCVFYFTEKKLNGLFGQPNRWPCLLQVKTVFFLFSNLYHFFPLSFLLHWLGPPDQCWECVMMVHILVLKTLSVSQLRGWCYWYLVGRGPGCCETSSRARAMLPQQRLIQPQGQQCRAEKPCCKGKWTNIS